MKPRGDSGRHEPIVDEGTFEGVRAILAERGESQALKRGHPSDMLSSLLRCGRCKNAYVGSAAHGRKNRYRYYVCAARYRYGTGFCDGDRLPKDALEDPVIEQMTELFRDTALIGEALALARAEEAEASEESIERLASIRQKVAGARRSLDRYFAAFEEAEERALQNQVSEALSAPPKAEAVAEWARGASRALGEGHASAAEGAHAAPGEGASRDEPGGDPADLQDSGAGSRTGGSGGA